MVVSVTGSVWYIEMGSLGLFNALSGSLGILYQFYEIPGIFGTVSGYFGRGAVILQDPTGSHEIPRDPTRAFEGLFLFQMVHQRY